MKFLLKSFLLFGLIIAGKLVKVYPDQAAGLMLPQAPASAAQTTNESLFTARQVNSWLNAPKGQSKHTVWYPASGQQVRVATYE